MNFPSDLYDVLFSLTFLSLIRKGKKINTSTFNFVDANSWLGAIIRTTNHESRHNTINFIHTVIRKTVEVIERYKNNKDLIRRLHDCIEVAISGLNELVDTYKDDPKTVAELKVCIDNMNMLLYNINSTCID